MKYGIFEMHTPNGNVTGVALSVGSHEQLYQILVDSTEEELQMIAESLMTGVAKMTNVRSMFCYENTLSWKEFENCMILCVINDKVSSQILNLITDTIFNHPEMLREAEFLEELGYECEELDEEYEWTNQYLLPNLSTLYDLPPCKGRVLEGYSGRYFLETESILDDFLKRRDDNDEEYAKVLLSEVEKIWDYER